MEKIFAYVTYYQIFSLKTDFTYLVWYYTCFIIFEKIIDTDQLLIITLIT